MNNKIILKRPVLNRILRINSDKSFHSFFFDQSLKQYRKNGGKFGSVLAVGANFREAEELSKYPFKKIVLSGITPIDNKTNDILKKDKRVTYKIEDMENISFTKDSFDLVFVKEAIHHVPRPVLALYECLRVSKNAIIFIEPSETFLGNLFEKIGLTSQYEKNQKGNLSCRDNFVYRWRKKEIIKILNSYFLRSGYKVIFLECWMTNRYSRFKSLTKYLNFVGWILSFVPFSRGNYLTGVIFEGKDKPGREGLPVKL